MELGICVHDAHVVNTLSPILPEFMDQEVALLLRRFYCWRGCCGFCGFGPGRICLWPLHNATYKDEGVVVHASRGESLDGQVRNPITELVVTHHDKAAPPAVKGTEDGESGVAAVAVLREVCGIYAISQEEGISPFLRNQFCPLYRGRLHRQPRPCLFCPPQLTCALERVPR